MSIDNSYLIFNSKEFELPYQFIQGPYISRDIYRKLMKEECKYKIQSNVSEEVFEQFRQYLIDGTIPEIHLDTIYEIRQLAREFQIQNLITKINEKKEKWREFERKMDEQNTTNENNNQANPNFVEQIEHLYQLLVKLERKIQSLENKFTIDLTEQSLKIKHECDEILNQKIEELTNNCRRIETEINEKFQVIEQEIQTKDDQIQTQNSIFQEHEVKIEQLNNQIELNKSEINTEKEHSNAIESEINAQLENLNQTITSIRSQLPNYVTKDIQKSYLFNQILFL